MIKVKELQRQLLLTDEDVQRAFKSLWIKPNEDNEISLRAAKRLTDWAEGYKEMSAIMVGDLD